MYWIPPGIMMWMSSIFFLMDMPRQVLGQTKRADGVIIPLLLKRADTLGMITDCIDEDPDTGDRVYGGADNDRMWVGLKDASKASWYTTDWNWMLTTTGTAGSFSCTNAHFTPDKITQFGHKIIAIQASSYSTVGSYVFFVDPKHASSPYFNKISESYQFSPKKMIE